MPAIYIHIPFCKQKCKYCDFNSYAGLDAFHRAYADALVSEIDSCTSGLEDLDVQSVFIGGGTPTRMDPALIDLILSAIARRSTVSADAEISIEANPETVTVGRMVELKRAGINRLSIGFQTLDDESLILLGRKHSAQGAVDSFRAAREAGYDNINIDLIFGIPGQSLAGWALTLEQTATLAPEHLSCYGLTVEPGTVLEREVASGLVEPPGEDLQSDMFIYTIESLKESGYDQYEISNYAKPGRRCRHNLAYWDRSDYIGFGAGAHSKIKNRRFSNVKAPGEYIKTAGSTSRVVEEEYLSVEDEMSETLFLGLRRIEGISLEDFETRFGRPIYDVYGDTISRLEEAGLVGQRNNFLKLTRKGILLGNEVFAAFV